MLAIILFAGANGTSRLIGFSQLFQGNLRVKVIIRLLDNLHVPEVFAKARKLHGNGNSLFGKKKIFPIAQNKQLGRRRPVLTEKIPPIKMPCKMGAENCIEQRSAAEAGLQ